ncbi:hypothetical protein JJB71_13335 [Clostridium perfringens]|uniref:hypothetical protein n=1 Tax=Clostridium perfringens TaxID=1502 RepID=UPI001ABAB746|nr:hypothetical protein [Clostridium perfringens]MBO3398522.1 hypothetical protein [Clostridium perfringens]
MKHIDLKENDLVLFKTYSDILKRETSEVGNVIYVREDNKIVAISWLDGYQSRIDDIEFDKVIAKIDKDEGEYGEIDNISGYFVMLESED